MGILRNVFRYYKTTETGKTTETYMCKSTFCVKETINADSRGGHI